MKISWIVFVCGCLLGLGLRAKAAEAASLFDGETLKGWEVVDHDKQFWSVAEGAIRCDSLGKKMPRNTFLFTEKSYDNFEFRCMVRLSGDPKTGMVNSGIQFRSEMHGNGNAKGYQADIGLPKWWGCIYDEHRRNRVIAASDMTKLEPVLKPFGWNEYVIRAVGPRVQMYINGVETVDYVEKDASIPLHGRFALQLHSGGICRIEYKDITIKELEGPTAVVAPTPKALPPKKTILKPGEVLFDDFESGTYDKWVVEGTAFGKAPVQIGTQPDYQGDFRAQGNYCVNTHASAPGGDTGGKDRATGTLTSKPFKITHDYLRFRIGGGNHKTRTCINLVIDDRHVQESATGDANNAMAIKAFSTKKYKGKQAYLQIVDAESGGWGNIGVDEIVFTNTKPKVAAVTRNVGKKTQSGRTESWTPEEQLAGFTVPEGFVVELVASEKDGIINPIDVTFDDSGRLWTNTATMYPMDPNPQASWGQTLKYMDNPDLQMADERFRRIKDMYQGKIKGDDAILVIDKLDGTPSKPRVWADGLAIPQSFLPYKNGAFVAHGYEMMYLSDTDGDGRADRRDTILSGFGYTDTHTMSHLLVRAPGGWINYSQGALAKGLVETVANGETLRVDNAKAARFSLDGSKHELVGSGLNNIWGYWLRASGQWFGSEANDFGASIVPFEQGTGFRGIGNLRLSPYQPWFPPPNKFRVGGTGLSGLAFSDDEAGSFPPEWQGVGFLANPITSKVNAVRIVRNPDGTVTSELLPDFVDSEDDWFRPVNMEFGPDGCLYIADFYNKIISHNEVSREHPDRDKTHGRIWRVRYVGAKPPAIVDYAKLPTAELPQHLKSPILWAKRAVWHQIVDRGARGLAPQVAAIAADSAASKDSRIAALWTLDGLDYYDKALMTELLKAQDGDLRREAVRALSGLPVTPDELAGHLQPLVSETNVMVRSQVLRTLRDFGKTNPALIDLAVSFCLPDSKSENLGGDYERKFERYLARVALEAYPDELGRYLDSAMAKKQPPEQVAWAAQALSLDERAKTFLKEWPAVKDKPLDDEQFVKACGLLRSPQVAAALAPVFEAEGAEYLVAMAISHQAEVASPQLAKLLAPLCQKLIASGDAAKLRTAAVAAAGLQIGGLEAQLAEALSKNLGDEAFVAAAVRVLANKPADYQSSFALVLESSGQGPDASMTALAALASVDPKAGAERLPAVAKALGPAKHAALANRLAASDGGCQVLLGGLASGVVSKAVVDRSLAERVAGKRPGDARANALVAEQRGQRQAEAKTAHAKIQELLPVALAKGGDAGRGKAVFTAMCLSCHTVGSEGAGLAPALDGSAHRDPEALLTAIFDPNAAVEGNYSLYRLFKRDGSSLEGYLEEDTGPALMLRFMGGGNMLVPKAEIADSGFVAGRSVMPTGLISGFSKDQVADLLAYIKTLK